MWSIEQAILITPEIFAKGLSLVSSVIVANPERCLAEAREFAAEYATDLPGDEDLSTWKAEVERWFHHATKSATRETLPDNVFDAVKLEQRLMASCICQLLCLVATFPVTTCSL